jgi:hypothetical protein
MGAGPKRMVNGRLESASLDVYIAMEFGSDGDLFNLRCGAHTLASCQPDLAPALERNLAHDARPMFRMGACGVSCHAGLSGAACMRRTQMKGHSVASRELPAGAERRSVDVHSGSTCACHVGACVRCAGASCRARRCASSCGSWCTRSGFCTPTTSGTGVAFP